MHPSAVPKCHCTSQVAPQELHESTLGLRRHEERVSAVLGLGRLLDLPGDAS